MKRLATSQWWNKEVLSHNSKDTFLEVYSLFYGIVCIKGQVLSIYMYDLERAGFSCNLIEYKALKSKIYILTNIILTKCNV